MKKIIKELLGLLCVLIVAAVIIIPIALNATARSSYDTFNGTIEKLPIDISSPTSGIVLTIPVSEGESVPQGETLARVQILDPHFSLINAGNLYSAQGGILTIHSPVAGVLGKIRIAPESTIGGNEVFMQMYTASATEIQIFCPRANI